MSDREGDRPAEVTGLCDEHADYGACPDSCREDFGDDPPPMAEQLRWLVIENRRLLALLADVETLCTTPVDGEQRSHVPVSDVLAAVRGEQ